ncbi:uncharacterized protein LOC110733245 [Chenopodium quinoa]|uniref:uncharacterized protein LOC110733245 n=1 Tax=Chenopodium quinoa TaxID=63459 RepID=UPI000B781E55|nr:uncharacterized protein LOC110733245 [Chenopodium quinoa]
MVFSSIFIAFKASIDGLNAGCRSLIGVDGAHLKGNYGGVLLSAIAIDGNNELFPVAWAIVGAEDADSWKFFLYHLKSALEPSGRGDNWCIISDRQKGIDPAISDIWPKVGRRYCCKHLVKNFKKKFPGLLMFQLFWKAAGAFNPFTFKKAMKALQKANPLALVWLAELGPQSRWSKHAFNPEVKCDTNKSNFVESFNSTLGIDRCRPVLTLLEGIRRVTKVRMATRREACENWRDDVCPNIMKRMHVISHELRTCKSLKFGDGEFEILDGRSMLPVNLREKTCVCNAWKLIRLPCKHAMRAILHSNEDPRFYISEWYSVTRYKLAYANSIKAIPDVDQWPNSPYPEIGPPTMKRGIGRPARNRRREEGEQAKGKRSRTVKCSKCQQFGHNAQTCQGGLTGKQKVALGESSASQTNKKQTTRKGKGASMSQPEPTTVASEPLRVSPRKQRAKGPISASQPLRVSPRSKRAKGGVSASQPA